MRGLSAGRSILWAAAAMLVLAAVFIGYAAYFVGAVEGPAASNPVQSLGRYGDAFALATILGALSGGLVLVAAVMAHRVPLAVQWPMRSTPRAIVAWTLAALLAFAMLAPLIVLLGDARGARVLMHAYRSASAPWLMWIALALAAPLFEELSMRGLVLPALAATRMGPRWAVAVTALAWALAHAGRHPAALATIFAFGLLLGAARLRSGSIAPPIAMHMAWNLVICALLAIDPA